MAFKPVVIDESDIARPMPVDITRWEPPRHVYFGPKDSRGRMQPEPKKSTAMYPSTRYCKTANGLKAIQVEDEAADKELGPEWKHSPADFGIYTHPTKEQMRAMEEDESEQRRPGRPRKEAA